MTVVMTAAPGKVYVEKLPTRWTVKDVERITGLEIVGVENRTHWVVCTLANGVRFSFKKW